ncbi:MAG: stage III sporulation protein AD [Clostridia bacterium]|nr:stage III sporulation protein AD [Clostridia bacterium]MDD7672102.1 SpoIIIAC/SpoIIIAD family protein [Clostridia bacterium]MDY2929825.1 SpoIIIAC/SpoIIIAD family protein [Clostridiaceae bacterium]
MGKLALTALLALCAMALVRSRAAALAVPLSLAAALTLLGMLLPRLSGLRGELSTLLESAGLTGKLFSPLLRVLAAGEITRFTAELCRDSGEKALAVTVELCGAAAAGLALLPLAKRALELIGSIGG